MQKRFFFFLFFLFLFFSISSEAHVSYVLGKQILHDALGRDNIYLLQALTGFDISLMIGTAFGIVLLYLFLRHNSWFQKHVNLFQQHAHTYGIYLAWIARLGLGIALIGAGTSDVLISPTLQGFSLFSTLQIALGFLLMAGLFTSLATIGAVALYLYALLQTPYLLGNLDFLGLALCLLALGSTRPGLDDLLNIQFHIQLHALKPFIALLARLGIGLSMIYLALYEKILNPHISQLVVTQYHLTSAIPVSSNMWVLSAGIIECIVGLFLVLGLFTRTTAAVAFLVLSASFFYFHEAVYAHVTLFAILSLVFVLGGGRASMDHLLQKPLQKKRRFK